MGCQIVTGGSAISSTISENTTLTSDSSAVSPLTVEDGITLTVADGVTLTVVDDFPQVESYTGGGIGTSSVTLSNDLASGSISSIINPIRLGVIRCGETVNLPNPQIGVAKSIDDYSVKRKMVNGGYTYELRNVGKSININLKLTNSQADSLDKFARAYRGKPFSALFLESMATNQNPSTRYSGFYYFSSSPSFNFNQNNANHVSASFSLSEVL